MSVVTQPGVDFGHTQVYPFIPEKAQPLSDAILTEDGLTYEAHSTDYQSTDALADLVKNHFFFLKVGPELTFRFREAVWALAQVEAQLDIAEPSNIRAVFEAQMTANPGYWQSYYTGDAQEVQLMRTYSYSDRIRYYWTDAKVSAALETLLNNLRTNRAPETLISQAFTDLEFGEMSTDPDALIERHVQRCVGRYFDAAGSGSANRSFQQN